MTVVVPALNEAENLPHVLTAVREVADDVVLVDGHSEDDTVAIASMVCPDVQVVEQDGQGKGNALACGLAECDGDIVVMLDADGSTDPAEIPRFVESLGEADFVKGSRFLKGGGSADLTRLRRVGNRVLTRLVNLLYGVRYSDLCYGFTACWTRSVPYLNLDCDGFEVETLMSIRATKAGLVVREVPSFEASRINGRSRLKPFRDGWRVLRTILRERIRPAHRPADAATAA